MIKKDVGYCWEKRDVIAESGHLFRLVKAGFIREHEFLIIGKEKKILQVANSLYLCSRKKKRDVAQLASAPRSGRGGRTFESSHPDLIILLIEKLVIRRKGFSVMESPFFCPYPRAPRPSGWFRGGLSGAALRTLTRSACLRQ